MANGLYPSIYLEKRDVYSGSYVRGQRWHPKFLRVPTSMRYWVGLLFRSTPFQGHVPFDAAVDGYRNALITNVGCSKKNTPLLPSSDTT